MGIVELDKIGESKGLQLPIIKPNVLEQIIRLVEAISQLINNPFIQQSVLKKMNINPNPETSTVVKGQPINKTTGAIFPEMNQEAIGEWLKNPEKKKQIIDLLNLLISFVGDIKLTQLKQQLEGET